MNNNLVELGWYCKIIRIAQIHLISYRVKFVMIMSCSFFCWLLCIILNICFDFKLTKHWKEKEIVRIILMIFENCMLFQDRWTLNIYIKSSSGKKSKNNVWFIEGKCIRKSFQYWKKNDIQFLLSFNNEFNLKTTCREKMRKKHSKNKYKYYLIVENIWNYINSMLKLWFLIIFYFVCMKYIYTGYTYAEISTYI